MTFAEFINGVRRTETQRLIARGWGEREAASQADNTAHWAISRSPIEQMCYFTDGSQRGPDILTTDDLYDTPKAAMSDPAVDVYEWNTPSGNRFVYRRLLPECVIVNREAYSPASVESDSVCDESFVMGHLRGKDLYQWALGRAYDRADNALVNALLEADTDDDVRAALAGKPRVSSPRKFSVCPRCGATSDETNFTTCPPQCDDCA